MERLKGFLIILLCNLVGNLINTLTGLPVPGSVMGLLLLLALLLTKRVKLETVEPAAGLLIALLTLFILPGGVSMMNSFYKFEGVIPQVVLIAAVSTLLSMISAAWVAQALARLRPGKQGEGDGNEPA